jgi:Flp pilus assembly protein TadG
LIKLLPNNEKGQSLVEFALLLVFVLPPILFGIIQFGLIFNGQVTITHAAREGARLAAVGKADDEIKSTVLNSATSTPFLNISSDSISINPSPLARVVGEEVDVGINASVDVVVPILDKIVGSAFPLASSASMRLEVGQTTPGTPTGGPIGVSDINISKSGNDLIVKVTVNPTVSNADVGINILQGEGELYSDGRSSTNSSGIASIGINHFYHNQHGAPSGTYFVQVTGINLSNYEWDGEPINYTFMK